MAICPIIVKAKVTYSMAKKPIVHKYKPKKNSKGAFIRDRMREGYSSDVLEIGTRRGYRRYRNKTAQSTISAIEPLIWPLIGAPMGAILGLIMEKDKLKEYAITGGTGALGAGLTRLAVDRILKKPGMVRALGPTGLTMGLLASPLVLNALGMESVLGDPM